MISFLDFPEKKIDEMLNWCNQRISGSLFYFSIDVRRSDFKSVPVDANFFPAGFGILTESSIAKATSIVKSKINKKNVLLITEDHTRNDFYFKNIAALKKILHSAGNDVAFSSLSSLEEAKSFSFECDIEKIIRSDNFIKTESGFVPDVVIVNHDMILERPKILQGLEQDLTPNIELGWFRRKKSDYIKFHEKVVKDFCKCFKIDDWLFLANWEECSNVNFKEKRGLEHVAELVEKVISRTKEKYNQYNIKEQPYAFIKANRGSYGMSVVPVSSPEEALKLNKNLRKKMHATKNKSIVDSIIVQEGIRTIDKHLDHPAEIMSYIIYGQVIGLIKRYNDQHSDKQNLNSRGMSFKDLTNILKTDKKIGLVSKLAIIAAEKEYFCAKESTGFTG